MKILTLVVLLTLSVEAQRVGRDASKIRRHTIRKKAISLTTSSSSTPRPWVTSLALVDDQWDDRWARAWNGFFDQEVEDEEALDAPDVLSPPTLVVKGPKAKIPASDPLIVGGSSVLVHADCLNGGTSLANGGCSCVDGFSGVRCETARAGAASAPSATGGSGGLSPGALAGIIVAVCLVCGVAAALLIVILTKRARAARNQIIREQLIEEEARV